MNFAKGSRARPLGKLNDVPVEHCDAIVKMDFVVLDNFPIDIYIGNHTIDRLGGVLDFQNSEVSFAVGGKKTFLSMILKNECKKDRGEDTSIEAFTSLSSEGKEKDLQRRMRD